MTKQEKKHKLKLIGLILIVNFVKWKKQPPKTMKEILSFAIENAFWVNEFVRLSQPMPKYPKGMAMVGNNDKKEVIIPRN